MGYMHIDNLYKNQTILLHRECFALEKIHGTSAHISWRASANEDGPVRLTFSSGGASSTAFEALFDRAKLQAAFAAMGHSEVTVYGEAYGGKMQRMRHTYGDELRFVVFDIMVGGPNKNGPGEYGTWLAVPNAANVAEKLGLEFVWWTKTSTDLAALNALRDQPSQMAIRRGIAEPRMSEGMILRPLKEFVDHRGTRLICKHKGEAFSETATPREVVDPAKQVVLSAAEDIAREWVTDMRLAHVLDKIPKDADGKHNISITGTVVKAMIEDVTRESAGEVVMSKEAARAVGTRAAKLFKLLVTQVLDPQNTENA